MSTSAENDPRGEGASEPAHRMPMDDDRMRPRDRDAAEGRNLAGSERYEPDATPRSDRPGAQDPPRDRNAAVEREKHLYGGMKIGSAFFGWLSATGMGVVLTALVAAAGTAVGVSTGTNPDEVAQSLNQDPQTVGMLGIIVLAAIVLVSYYCGGYVAGRMARFHGARQGVAVWLWALVISAVVALLGWIGGSQYNVLAQVNSFPRIPVNEGTLSAAGIIALVVVAAVALLGAVLGGLAGMRFHRRVDKAGSQVS
ncbi:hypothetical protein RF641_01160 [Arthrobacter sp. LS16]|uniref:hypothetical protein n=1 Tax=Arthrobacter sp. 'calajunan' TaxID=1690248 RepID=UPI003C70F87F